MPRLTSSLLLLSQLDFAPGAAAMTCGGLKDFYKNQDCCGDRAKPVDTMLQSSNNVTEDMVEAAQKEWGDGIVNIAAAKVNNQDFEQVAHDHITDLYAYGSGTVLFKPTLAAERQFRSSFEGALSYFVATNSHSPEDGGFAIKGWTAVRFENEAITISANTAMAMGNYFFTTPDNKEVKVEYSFGYVLDAEGKLRINMHHSSMPYQVLSCGSVTKQMVEAVQKEWGDGIVTIAAKKTAGQDFEQAARDHIDNLYAYGEGDVLFKPTLAAQAQFRSSFDGALSYFVATNNEHPEDGGFAIKGWTAVRFVNEDIITSGNTAMAMGNYFFTNPEGAEVKVEYSFGYVLDDAGRLRINLHHSSLPFEVATVAACNDDGSATRQMVLDAQKTWGDGIVAISNAYTAAPQEDYEQVARDLVTNLYAYSESEVAFKPTLAATAQFRPTFDGALSYFVATNNEHPEDGGFAIKGWTHVRFENEEIVINGDTAAAMGNYYFTKNDGSITKVEYSFGYMLDLQGALRINLHHSSLPYSA